MPRTATGSAGVLTIRIEIRDTEHPMLYRELVAIESGARRRVRLFSLAHMGLALEMSGTGNRGIPEVAAATTEVQLPDATRLSRSELAELFGDNSTHHEEQGA